VKQTVTISPWRTEIKVFVWSDSLNQNHMLLSKNRKLTKRAASLAKGDRVLERELPAFDPAGKPMGIDGEKAGRDLESKGFHAFTVRISVG
jgi:hypothetical protein